MLVTLRDDLLQPIARAKPTSAARPPAATAITEKKGKPVPLCAR